MTQGGKFICDVLKKAYVFIICQMKISKWQLSCLSLLLVFFFFLALIVPGEYHFICEYITFLNYY